MYYKPKVNSNSLLTCRLTDKALKEIPILGALNFQTASVFRKIDQVRYICIGGLDNGERFLLLNLLTKTYEQLISPPMPLSYGNAIYNEGILYVLGSLIIESSGQEKPAPPLSYNLTNRQWSELSSMPLNLTLFGSYLQGNDIYALGGYLNYPENPSHFKSMLIFNTNEASWRRSYIETPIFQGLPACCVIDSDQIIIIGGHDPCDNIGDVESRSTYIYNNSTFESCTSLPVTGQLRFIESPVYHNGQVFIYSEDDILFIYNLSKKEWSYLDCELSIQNSNNVEPDMYQTLRTYLYRYIPADCEIVEYNLTFSTQRTTQPSSFKYTFEYTGMCLLEDGKLMFAGGVSEDSGPTNRTWTFNPKVGSSNNTADLPHKQFGLRMVVVNSLVYAIAGNSMANDKYANWCQKYLPGHDIWSPLPSMEYSVFLPGVSVLGNKLYAFAGKGEQDMYFLVQALNLYEEKWEVMEFEYPCSVYGLCSANVGQKILCFGGKDPQNCDVPDCYLFDGEDFHNQDNLPDDIDEDSTMFCDPAVVSMGTVYAVCTAGIVFSYSNNKWAIIRRDNK
ncbi:hypothetical protein SteCoe_585 [Stentor coeruleus]|uniref:Uncharacterized protein n=1 Tax=Stentor coeruleus TaxID=5963 RepID=A0A1R2D3P1_9CILI|nr:hypothetical protein SteCoe_585 [Stentor coeruleus]